MKIMLVNTLYAPYRVGGAEISVQILCEELARRGHQVRVITLTDKAQREFAIINGVEVVYLPLRNIYWPFTTIRRNAFQRLLWHFFDSYNFLMRAACKREFVRFKPDVIHTNNLAGFSVAVWSLAHSLNIGIIHTSRDYYLLHPSTTLSRRGQDIESDSPSVLFWSFLKRTHSKKVSCYVGISAFIMDFHLEQGFFKHACNRYIYNPVSVHVRGVDKPCKKRIGFIGRMTKEKGFDTFCHIMLKLRNDGYAFSAISAGEYYDTPEAIELQNLARSVNIRHLGRVSTEDFLDNVDIVILPFRWREPFGRVIVESALAHKHVLVSAVGGARELIELIPGVKEITLENIQEALNAKNNVEINSDVTSLFDVKKITDEYITAYGRAKQNGRVDGAA